MPADARRDGYQVAHVWVGHACPVRLGPRWAVNEAERAAAQATLATLSGAATAAGAVLTGVGGIVARVISAALDVASAMLSQGATPQQAVDAIKRVRHIDTSADDAAVDRKVDAKPLGKRFQEIRPVMQAAPVDSLEPPVGMWTGPQSEED